jgi:hypothetical protein
MLGASSLALAEIPMVLPSTQGGWRLGALISPSLRLIGDAYELSLAAEIGARRGGSAVISLDEARLRVALAEAFFIEWGRMRLEPSQALLLPVSNFLCPPDREALLSGREGGLSASEDMFRAVYSSPSFWAGLAFLPFAPPIVLPDPASPWFPRRGIPDSIAIFDTYLLRDIVYLYDETDPGRLDYDPSVHAAAFLSGSLGDIGFSFFQGRSRTPTVSAEVDLSGITYPVFDVYLRPERGYQRSFGLSAALPLGSLRLCLDAAYNLGLLLPGTDYVKGQDNFRSAVVSSDEAALSGGFLWSPEAFPLSLAAEASWTWYPRATGPYSVPAFARLLAINLGLSGLDGALDVDGLGLFSLQDGSAALAGRLSLGFGADARAFLCVPVFIGGLDDVFGQFKRAACLSLGLEARF